MHRGPHQAVRVVPGLRPQGSVGPCIPWESVKDLLTCDTNDNSAYFLSTGHAPGPVLGTFPNHLLELYRAEAAGYCRVCILPSSL